MGHRSSLNIVQVISQRRLLGAERLCLMLSDSLQRRGHRVVLLCKNEPVMLREAERRGLDTRTPGISGKLNPFVAQHILRVAREIDADVIHTHLSTASLWGGVAGRIAHIPVLSHVQAMNTKTCFMFANQMVACSEGVRNHIISQNIHPERIKTIYNGIERDRFVDLKNRARMREDLGIPENVPAVACVAHLADKKGQATLVNAVALLKGKWPEIRCCLVGDGENMALLKKLTMDLGIENNVLFLGYRMDSVSIMNAMDIFILPSLGKEGMALVLLEAALLGLPSVCSNIPGNDEVVIDGTTGLLFTPGNESELAQKIDTILSDVPLRNLMAITARERSEHLFTIDAMTDQIESLYREMIENQS